MSFIGKIFGAIIRVAFVAIGAMLGGPIGAFIGAIIGSFVAGAVESLFTKKPSTKTEVSKVNVRVGEPIRWLAAGQNRMGGAVLFAEFDSAGNLWYLVVHCDSILVTKNKVLLDENEVTLDGSGNVTTADFCLDSKGNAWTAGTKVPYVQIWTTTYSESNPTPPAISALAAAFPTKWTSDHKLVGTTYSVVKMKALKVEDRHKIYKWRGPLGLGEPSVSIVGDWGHAFDPRDGTQTNNVPTSYKFTRNPVLLWVWFRTHRYGRNKSRDSINWARIAEQATICDETVSGLVGTHTRYLCDVTIPEDRTRSDAEQDIMITMDAQLVFDDDGKCWPRVGKYVAPTLVLTRNRDIVAMESVEAQNGESETQGVIIRYTDPTANYAIQPSAAWLNPHYYNAGEAASFLTIEAPAIQDHNQAMRIAKAIGLRVQPPYKLAPTTGLRGLKAMRERFTNLNYDNTFAGDHEIATQVQLDAAGVFCTFGLVPVDANRWDLLAGEEKPKPVVGAIDGYTAPDIPTGITITYANSRIEASFTPRFDIGYEIEYIKTSLISGDVWADMTVKMPNGFAYSGPVDLNVEYSIRFRAVAASGRVSAWSSTVTLTPGPTGNTLQQVVFSSWIVEAVAGTSIIAITSGGSLTISSHTRRYSDGHADVAVTGTTIATGLASGTTRAIGYDDVNRVGGAVTYNLYALSSDAEANASHPGRHYVGLFTVPASGTGGGTGNDGGLGNSRCVVIDAMILLADEDHTGPGECVRADQLRVGDWVWTWHEITHQWGAFMVTAIEIATNEPIYAADDYPSATPNHRFFVDGEWKTMNEIGVEAGFGDVVKITVDDAHTYISNGVISHNIKAYN